MFKAISLLLLICLLTCSAFASYDSKLVEIEDFHYDLGKSKNIFTNYRWKENIRPDHPRLFLNNDMMEGIKKRVMGDEREVFKKLNSKIDSIIDHFKSPNGLEDIIASDYPQHKFGILAAESAFLFLITEEYKYFDLSRKLLQNLIEFYQMENRAKRTIDWYSHSRIHTLMAYDWIFNDLSVDDRMYIGKALFREIEFMLPTTKRESFYRENRSGTNGGFYNNQALTWYLGLVFYESGIRDIDAEVYLKQGYDNYIEVLEYRKEASGDDGGAASGTLAYSLVDYPWAEYNFFHTFLSATGYDITKQYEYLPNFVNYLYWNLLPQNREFGFGDTSHKSNSIDFSILNLHLSQLIHFYGERYPEHASIAKWLIDQKFPRKLEESTSFPITRFLINPRFDSVTTFNPEKVMPHARYFEKMGQFFMRSGSEDSDTYATFTVSTNLAQHKHYDNNNFNIYKKGFLTLDSGTRPQPGLHLSHYYSRTIAHNCVTIRMPDEQLPRYWGTPAPNEKVMPIPNDGGQNNIKGTNVIAFDEKDYYVYIASDATDSYHTDKTNQVLRQFLFLPPDHFVVFDRVNATKAYFKKKWLLHTAFQPEMINSKTFVATHEEGKLICKTIYPDDPEVELIGGPGKQFWSDGINWSLPNGGENHLLYGQWRVEISPSIADNDDVFLHLIHVGDSAEKNQSIASAEKIERNNMKGVKFEYNGKEYSILFAKTGVASGEITITTEREIILNEKFSQSVKNQSGLSFNIDN